MKPCLAQGMTCGGQPTNKSVSSTFQTSLAQIQGKIEELVCLVEEPDRRTWPRIHLAPPPIVLSTPINIIVKCKEKSKSKLQGYSKSKETKITISVFKTLTRINDKNGFTDELWKFFISKVWKETKNQ